jgi:hypothetical protein
MLGVDIDWGGSRVSMLTIDASFVRCAGTFAVARFLTGVAAAWNADDGATYRSLEEVNAPGEWPPTRLGWFHYFGRDRASQWPDALWSDPALYMVVRSHGGGIGLCVAPEPFADQLTVEAQAAQAAEVIGLSIRPHRRTPRHR